MTKNVHPDPVVVPPTPPPLDGATLAADPPLGFLTRDQLRAVYGRIELVSAHMNVCCGGGPLRPCRYASDHRRLCDVLLLAGAPPARVPFNNRVEFEAWLVDREAR